MADESDNELFTQAIAAARGFIAELDAYLTRWGEPLQRLSGNFTAEQQAEVDAIMAELDELGVKHHIAL